MSAQHQLARLLGSNLILLTHFDFSPEEIAAAGWSPELTDKVRRCLAQMQAQVRQAGLTDPTDATAD